MPRPKKKKSAQSTTSMTALPTKIKEGSDELRSEATDLQNEVESLTVINDEGTLSQADGLLVSVKQYIKRVKSHHEKPKRLARAAWKSICDAENSLLDPAKEAESKLKTAIANYHRRLLDQQKQEQSRLTAAMTEAARQDAIDRAIEISDHDPKESERLLSNLDDVKPTAMVPAVDKGVKTSATSVRMLKRFKVVDVNKINRPFLEPNTKAIQAIVDRLGKGAEGVVGGIEYYEKPSVSTRT